MKTRIAIGSTVAAGGKGREKEKGKRKGKGKGNGKRDEYLSGEA